MFLIKLRGLCGVGALGVIVLGERIGGCRMHGGWG